MNCDYVEKTNFKDKPPNNDKMANLFASSFFEDDGILEHEVLVTTFHILNHSRDMDYWKICRNPIYDICGDVSNEEIAYFEPLG